MTKCVQKRKPFHRTEHNRNTTAVNESEIVRKIKREHKNRWNTTSTELKRNMENDQRSEKRYEQTYENQTHSEGNMGRLFSFNTRNNDK